MGVRLRSVVEIGRINAPVTWEIGKYNRGVFFEYPHAIN